MKNLHISLLFLLLAGCASQQTSPAPTQKLQSVTLEDIWRDYTFTTHRMHALNSMQGDFYTLLGMHRDTKSTSVDKYSYKTLEKVATLIDSKDIENLDYFESYSFDKKEKKLLLKTASEPIYRHSERAWYSVYDLETKKLLQVDTAKIQSPAFSPDGNRVAYVKNNNIYIKDLSSGENRQITNDGKHNFIINGLTDWVYEEEFGFVRAFQWNSDGTQLAFLRFDESEVPEFTMMKYGQNLYPQPVSFKYPKAGEKNSVVSLHVYDIASKRTRQITLNDDVYIPRIKWTHNPHRLTVQTLNRRQNNLKLYAVNTETLQSNLLLKETSGTYVNVRDALTFLQDNSFIWRSERSGFDHLYYYDAQGHLINPITQGSWDVIKFYGIDESKHRIFYLSHEDGSINQTVYAINLDGTDKKRLSKAYGTNSASFSKNKKYFINNFSDSETPPVYTLHRADGTLLKTVMDNEALLKLLQKYNIAKKTFSTISTANGTFNMWMIKPNNFNPQKKYPLLMYQYSGPGVQTVQNRWMGFDDYWYSMLAEKGYIIASVDGRGTGGKGSNFTKVTYKELGKYETIDQIESAKYLGTLPYIDAQRIGIWGWSFGGFTSSNCILKGNDVFEMAIAVAPVTSWRFYDTVYTERYMQTPQENPDGYDNNSPLNFAGQLKGKFLLVHGTGDDNVHVENSMRLINEFIKANVPYDSEFYPDRTHGIYRGANTRLHLYKRMTRFIEKNL